ncbi:putative bifunctional diguanylate cyclase/phosphodiesterase [Actinophytocola sp.]|uniref:putative bifunctional diguanylate cyclase/phosphodiesterase n=1 Tax=Actinophytocola sp. TaxID=1872138 RepID=UPI002D7E8098|nr:EAL domain-containing protein [Actinophytocola sp.]HET9140204.1 EAL domain-containing protein [Actinophytocola sp.]
MDRTELVSRWAGALTQIIYVARSRDEVEQELHDLLDRMIDAVRSDKPGTAREVGLRLAELGFTKTECVGATLDLLGTDLPDLSDLSELDGRLQTMPSLSALATGFTTGMRNRLFAEQEEIKRALTHAKENVERDLQASEELFREVFTSSSVGMALADLDGVLARTNRALATILEYTPRELSTLNMSDLFHPSEAELLTMRYQELLEKDALPFRERRKLRRKGGDAALVYLSGQVIRHPDGTPRHFVLSVEDVSDKQLIEDQLRRQLVHDPLTNLANRQRFLSRIEEVLAGNRAAESVAILHIDLDGFAAVNNGAGRDIGDQLLQVVAKKLTTVMEGERATVARLDGDEFGIVLEYGPQTPSPELIAQRINDELGEPYYVGEQGVAATACIAVLDNPRRDLPPAQLLQATDITLRRLKSTGRRQWALVDSEQGARDRDRFNLAASIPGAWESGEIQLEYQTVVSIDDRRIVAVQPQLRWEHPEQGVLEHDVCVGVLEETGMSLPIGRWKLNRACEQIMAWQDRAGVDLPQLYVELTRQQASDPDLVSSVQGALASTGMPTAMLRLGMPVQALCMTDGTAEDNLDVLVDLGIRTVLYEFGTTRGDLACLEDLPVHAVKMADRVVRRISTAVEHGRQTLFLRATRDLIPLVRDTGAEVLVGNIHTEEQAAWWREVGAATASGPLFGAAHPPEEIEELLGAEPNARG